MLKKHKYYVYYDGNKVLARMESQKPVVAETLATAQEAHDSVQEIVNPSGKQPTAFGPLGFHEPSFQAAISSNCERYVKQAYAATESKGKKAR